MLPSLEPSRRDGSNDGSQICYYGKIWINIPKVSLLPIFIWRTAAKSSKESHMGNYITGSIITEGVFCIVENICL